MNKMKNETQNQTGTRNLDVAREENREGGKKVK